MSFFHHHSHSHENLDLIRALVREDELLSIIIEDLIRSQEEKKHQRVRLGLTTIINNSKFQIMSLQLNQGQFSVDSLQLFDADTNAQVAATFGNTSFTSDNPAVLSTAPDPNNPNQSIDTAVAPGTANLTAKTDATYTDSVSLQLVTKTVTVTILYTVIAVVAGENVKLVIIQGTPQVVVAPTPAPVATA